MMIDGMIVDGIVYHRPYNKEGPEFREVYVRPMYEVIPDNVSKVHLIDEEGFCNCHVSRGSHSYDHLYTDVGFDPEFAARSPHP